MARSLLTGGEGLDKVSFGTKKIAGPSGYTAFHILQYLIDHPDAKDTIEGVIKWWLTGIGVQPTQFEVQEALDFLVSRGWVTKREITPSQKVYWVNKDRIKEIKAFLSGAGDKAQGGNG